MPIPDSDDLEWTSFKEANKKYQLSISSCQQVLDRVGIIDPDFIYFLAQLSGSGRLTKIQICRFLEENGYLSKSRAFRNKVLIGEDEDGILTVSVKNGLEPFEHEFQPPERDENMTEEDYKKLYNAEYKHWVKHYGNTMGLGTYISADGFMKKDLK